MNPYDVAGGTQVAAVGAPLVPGRLALTPR
jgi:hypothetical protein